MIDTKNSTLVVISKEIGNITKFLVYIAPKGKAFEGQYRLIGGKIKTGENYVSTLERELVEEYGVEIFNLDLLYEKDNVLGGRLFLAKGEIKGDPIKNEIDVGDPEWKTAEELFASNFVHNCKIALYSYFLKYDLEKLNQLVSIIKNDHIFISHMEKEAKDLHQDLMTRIMIGSN